MKNCYHKFLKLAIIILSPIFWGCAKEPIFELPPALVFQSWLEFKDTNWNGSGLINNLKTDFKAVSNYVVLSGGSDTSISIRINFEKNSANIEQMAFKFRKGLSQNGGLFKSNSIENIFIETNNAVFNSNDIKIDSISFELAESSKNKTYEIKNFTFKASTSSISQVNIQVSITSNSFEVLQSYFDYYQKGKKVQTEKELLNVDLKGGGEYNPKPLFDYKPDLRNPNDFMFLNIPTESLRNAPNFNVKDYLKYSKKGKFFPAESGTISIESFYFKNSINLSGKNWVFNDTTVNSNIITIDSLRLQQFSMPF